MSQKNKKKQKSLHDYLEFLESYWSLFKPPEAPKPKKEYKNILL